MWRSSEASGVRGRRSCSRNQSRICGSIADCGPGVYRFLCHGDVDSLWPGPRRLAQRGGHSVRVELLRSFLRVRHDAAGENTGERVPNDDETTVQVSIEATVTW